MVSAVSGTSTGLVQLIRPVLRHAEAYVPATIESTADHPVREIKLDMNESPYGPSPRVAQALASFHLTNRYPSFQQDRLREAIAAYAGVPARQVVPGSGMDDVLTNLYTTFVDHADEVVIAEPTFGVYRHAIGIRGGVTVDVPLGKRPDFAFDVGAILAAMTDRTKLIMVCNPNNPTGHLIPSVDIERLVQAAPCLVVIDEAYAEFSGQTQLGLMSRYENVCVLRTMSKWAGLAGMRIGYGIFPEWMLDAIWSAVPAFCNISTAAEAAAVAALEDADYLRGVVQRMNDDRDAFAIRLRTIDGVQPFESATNFLLLSLPVIDAGPVREELARRGIHVRYFANPAHGLRDCLRVSIGTPEENMLFADELEQILQEQHA